MVESLVLVLRAVGLVVSKKDIYFPNVGNMFSQEGGLIDGFTRKRIKDAYDELIWLARTFKWSRENFN